MLNEPEIRQEIIVILDSFFGLNVQAKKIYSDRITGGKLTRDENPVSHFCIYFLPFNPKTGKVFVVHHKKSGKWLSPGGHVDRGESLLQCLNREIAEELGVVGAFKTLPDTFLFTYTPINDSVPCKEHFDIWFLFETDGDGFQIDSREFHDAKWMKVEDADQVVFDPANLKALDKLKYLK